MKKRIIFSLSFGLLAATCAQAQDLPAGQQRVPIMADLGGQLLGADGSIFTVFPAKVTLEGQWCDIALWNAPFSIAEYPSFRVVLQRGTEEDHYVQLFARNHESTGNWAGPYMPFKKNQTLFEGDFADWDDSSHSGGYFEDDPLCTWFALQKTNIGPDRIQVTITEAALINEDGEEIVSRNVRNGSWKPSPDWNEPDSVYEGSVLFTNKGTVGVYTANEREIQVTPGTVHRYTFRTAEPMPKGFTYYVMLDDGDDSTYEYEVPAGVTEWTAPDIDDNYKFAFLIYDGAFPQTVHFTSITRDVCDLAGIRDAVSMKGVARRDVYTADGIRQSHSAHGLSIVRDRMDDGTVRVKKTIR